MVSPLVRFVESAIYPEQFYATSEKGNVKTFKGDAVDENVIEKGSYLHTSLMTPIGPLSGLALIAAGIALIFKTAFDYTQDNFDKKELKLGFHAIALGVVALPPLLGMAFAALVKMHHENHHNEMQPIYRYCQIT